MRMMPNTHATKAALDIDRGLIEKAWKGFMANQPGWLAIPESELIPEWDRLCADFIHRNT